MNIALTLPDGRVVNKPSGVTPAEVAASIGKRLARDAVAARVDDVLMDLNVPLDRDCRISIVTINTPEGLEIMRHSAAHVMAAAVGRLFGKVKFGIGPSIEEGFLSSVMIPYLLPRSRLPAEPNRLLEQTPTTCR